MVSGHGLCITSPPQTASDRQQQIISLPAFIIVSHVPVLRRSKTVLQWTVAERKWVMLDVRLYVGGADGCCDKILLCHYLPTVNTPHTTHHSLLQHDNLEIQIRRIIHRTYDYKVDMYYEKLMK